MTTTLLFHTSPPPTPLSHLYRGTNLPFPVDSSACPAISITVSKLSLRRHHLKICGCQDEPLEQEGDVSRSVPDQGCKPNVQDFHRKRGRSCWFVFHCDKISCHMSLIDIIHKFLRRWPLNGLLSVWSHGESEDFYRYSCWESDITHTVFRQERDHEHRQFVLDVHVSVHR